jgi:hypothetical protein
MFTSGLKHKWILGANWKSEGNSISHNNTYFEVEQHFNKLV